MFSETKPAQQRSLKTIVENRQNIDALRQQSGLSPRYLPL
jgi:hypothetical protein